MPKDRLQITVGVDGSPGAEAAIRWAVDEAAQRDIPLRVVGVYHEMATYGAIPLYGAIPDNVLTHQVKAAEHLVAAAVRTARSHHAGVDVRGVYIAGEAAQALVEQSRRAAMIVLGSRQLSTLGATFLGSVGTKVAARAVCPVVLVRGPGGLPEEDPAVVAAVDGTDTAEEVLAFAFDYASWHRAPLKVLLCWHPGLLAAMERRPEPPPPPRTELWLSEALAGWGEKYPEVAVRRAVRREHPVSALVAESVAQQLLVVGTRGRHALTGTLLGSVSQGVLHHALCPVAVVPTTGAQRHPR